MLYLIIIFVLCTTAVVIDSGMAKPGLNQSTQEQKVLNLAIVCMLIYIAGFRNMGGTDFSVYNIVYNNAPELPDFIKYYESLDDRYFIFGMDRGYIFVNSVMNTLGFSYYGYNLCHSLFCFAMIYFCTRKYTNNFSVVIMVILYKMFFYDFFISLRQTITIAIFFYMLRDIEDEKPIRYYLLCLLCYWIHAAAIVLFVVYFIKNIKLSAKTIIILNIIFLPTLFLSALNVPVLKAFEGILEWENFGSEEIAGKAESLINEEGGMGINWLHTAEYFLIMFLVIWKYDEIVKKYPQADIIIKLFLCLLPIFTLFRNYLILTRWKDYFTITYGFILSYYMEIDDRKYRKWAVWGICLWVGFGYFRYINVFDGGAFYNYFPVRGLVDLWNKPF